MLRRAMTRATHRERSIALTGGVVVVPSGGRAAEEQSALTDEYRSALRHSLAAPARQTRKRRT
jgi:hypothetical protein